MNNQLGSNLIVIRSADASVKTTDVVEKIITCMLQSGEVNVAGMNEGIFLACSAANMATEIAKVYINDLYIGGFNDLAAGSVFALVTHLAKEPIGDYALLAGAEEKAMENTEEQTVSVSRASSMERLITVSLLKLARFDKIRIAAAGGSIIDAVSLAFKLSTAQISKDPLAAKLVHLYSIKMRNDPTKSIAAISIYLQKGLSPNYSKGQLDLLKKLESGK